MLVRSSALILPVSEVEVLVVGLSELFMSVGEAFWMTFTELEVGVMRGATGAGKSVAFWLMLSAAIVLINRLHVSYRPAESLIVITHLFFT